jgi:orotate phosphoribosyltransferase
MNKLLDQLLETGLLQFGRFNNGQASLPFQFHLEMLPAYPGVLKYITQAFQHRLDLTAIEHFVATSDAIPLGIALSLQTSIPLAYSSAKNPHQFVGAYDIGHPALLITNVVDNTQKLSQLAQKASQVGLEVQSLAAIVDVDLHHRFPLNMPVQALFQLSDVIEKLAQAKRLPDGQAQTVLDWIVIRDSQLP